MGWRATEFLIGAMVLTGPWAFEARATSHLNYPPGVPVRTVVVTGDTVPGFDSPIRTMGKVSVNIDGAVAFCGRGQSSSLRGCWVDRRAARNYPGGLELVLHSGQEIDIGGTTYTVNTPPAGPLQIGELGDVMAVVILTGNIRALVVQRGGVLRTVALQGNDVGGTPIGAMTARLDPEGRVAFTDLDSIFREDAAGALEVLVETGAAVQGGTLQNFQIAGFATDETVVFQADLKLTDGSVRYDTLWNATSTGLSPALVDVDGVNQKVVLHGVATAGATSLEARDTEGVTRLYSGLPGAYEVIAHDDTGSDDGRLFKFGSSQSIVTNNGGR